MHTPVPDGKPHCTIAGKDYTITTHATDAGTIYRVQTLHNSIMNPSFSRLLSAAQDIGARSSVHGFDFEFLGVAVAFAESIPTYLAEVHPGIIHRGKWKAKVIGNPVFDSLTPTQSPTVDHPDAPDIEGDQSAIPLPYCMCSICGEKLTLSETGLCAICMRESIEGTEHG